jgi:Tfp pilus assembly protein PilF
MSPFRASSRPKSAPLRTNRRDPRISPLPLASTPNSSTVILSEVPRSASPRGTSPKDLLIRSRHLNRSNLFATALVFTFLIIATKAQSQLPAGTTDTAQQPASADTTLLKQANDALGKSDYTTALPILQKLSVADPKDAHLLFDLGLTQDNLDHGTEAAEAYRASATADPKFASPHLALGLLLARDNKPAEAHTELLAAANLAGPANDPDTAAQALRALAKLDITTNAADARDELLTAIKLSAETPDDVLLSAQIAETLNDLPLAETAYKRLLTKTPNDVATTAALAHVLRLENKLADAESILTAALERRPGDTALTAQLASAYLAEDDPAKSAQAVPLAETLHQQHPEDASVTRLLARLYAQTKQPAKADPLYSTLLKQAPNDPTLLDDYGANLLHLARFADAEAVLKRAVADPKAFPTTEDLAAAYSDLAFSASENNDPTITLQALDLRAKVAPITAGSVFLEATAQDKLHQYKKASELYKQFLDLPEVKANGKFADQEWEVKHRLIALEHMK